MLWRLFKVKQRTMEVNEYIVFNNQYVRNVALLHRKTGYVKDMI